VRRSAPDVVFKHPKSYFRYLPDLWATATFVDLTKPSETSKRHYLIAPEAVDNGALEKLDAEAYEAWLFPLVDRDLDPYLWEAREFNRDGAPIDAFETVMNVLREAEEFWTKCWWKGRRWEWEHAPKQEAMGDHGKIVIPPSLVAIDDWIEAALPGRIIRTADAVELERLRGRR
jgi:hypothetical protein